MALNFPGPMGIRFFYTTQPSGFQPMTHKLELNVYPVGDYTTGYDFAEMQFRTRADGVINAQTACNAFIDLVKPMFPTSADFTIVEAWLYQEESFEAHFVSAYSPAQPGTGGAATAAQAGGQAIFTFRTMEGGIAKFSLMESTHAPGTRQAYPTPFTPVNALMAYVASPTTWIWGRDTSPVGYPLNFLPGQSEAVFKKRFRP
jgi:hypothetical protein